MEHRNIWLSNSLKRKKEEFKPLDAKNIRMYACGPTVYDRAHIGNARAVVVFDVLYRLLRHKYGSRHVKYVRNITDVDDKINAAAKERGIEISELTEKTTAMFHADMALLNCLSPDIEPRATDHIHEMLDMIGRLIKNGNAYAANSHVLFRVSSDAQYGHLSGRSTSEMVAGARVEVAPYKENPMDFVLWKPSQADEPGWESPWGRGRPGWHIECSAMSIKYLGETFDIHGGGADLTFPHHENEIAQSCCAYPGSLFAKYWVHNGFLSVNGEKMSKSLGNFVTVKDLLDRGIKGEVIRYALLATHYKSPLDWNEKLLYDAQKTMDRFYKIYEQHLSPANLSGAGDKVMEYLEDDLNTAKIYAYFNEKAHEYNHGQAAGAALELIASLRQMGFLSLTPDEYFGRSNNNSQINNLIELRKAARSAKNWAESDRIRDELLAMGVLVEDKAGGVMEWRLK
jgi:cysteinyl-tRNA synthetase